LKKILLGVAALFGLVVLFFIGVLVVSEIGGEVVVLESIDADGESHETRLWVVEYDGHAWLRAGMPESAWLVRIQGNPEVTITRAGEPLTYRAVPVPDPVIRDRIHALMRESYPFADAYISVMRDPDGSVPVRLDAIPGRS
jgi:hypothetical protein